MNQKVVLEILNFFLDEKHMLPKNSPLNIRIPAGNVHRNKIYYAHLPFFKFEHQRNWALKIVSLQESSS